MRLVRYVLLELAVGAALLAGGAGAVYLGAREVLETRSAQAAVAQFKELAREPARPPRLTDEPRRALDPLEPPARPPLLPAPMGYFLGFSDEVLIEPLRDHAVIKVKFNRGGSSVSMRLDFISGGRAAFKPDQTNMQSIPRKEVASYRINRMLGLSSVAPAIPGAYPREDLIAAMTPEAREVMPRFQLEVPSTTDGMVTGSVAWWIPEIVDAKVQGFGIDSVDGIVLWKRYLTVGEVIPRNVAHLMPQISEMVAFDFLINNFDRWSGSNAKASPDGKRLYFMDNALSFGLDGNGQLKVRIYLKRSQKFSRRLYHALRALDRDDVTDAMMTDTGPWPSLLTDPEIAAMMKRRDRLIAYIDSLIAQHGEAAVLVFP